MKCPVQNIVLLESNQSTENQFEKQVCIYFKQETTLILKQLRQRQACNSIIFASEYCTVGSREVRKIVYRANSKCIYETRTIFIIR